jgi:hypothetical protein
VLGQVFGQFVEADGGAAVLLGQRPAAFDRAVGDGDLLRLLGAEVGGAQFDHLAGADEQDALLGNRLEDALGQMHAGRRHGHDIGADGGRAAHFLGDREGALEQLVQLRAERAVFSAARTASFIWPRICGSPMTIESRPLATRKAWRMASGWLWV